MRLSLGIGVIFIPFGLVLSAEYGLAATYASHLSELVTGFVAPFAFSPPLGESAVDVDEIPVAALVVSEDVESDAIAEPGKVHKGKRKSANSKGSNPGELPAIRVRAYTVLRLANSGRRPRGKSVTADGRRPAGIQVFGASSLGVGVRDGDVITRVSGVAVTSPNEVIALVIAARGARQAAISAQIYRGQRSYMLTVELPYLEGSPPPSSPEAPADAQ